MIFNKRKLMRTADPRKRRRPQSTPTMHVVQWRDDEPATVTEKRGTLPPMWIVLIVVVVAAAMLLSR